MEGYVNQAVRGLEEQKRLRLERRERLRGRPAPAGRRLRFAALDFSRKKQADARLIREIRLSGNRAEILWNV